VLLKILRKEGDEAAIGDAIAIVGNVDEDISDLVADSDTAKAEKEPESQKTSEKEVVKPEPENKTVKESVKEESKKLSDVVRSSPMARKLAAKHGLEIQEIKGSGPHGRIVEKDVQAVLSKTIGEVVAGKRKEPAAPAGEDEVIPVSPKRKVIAERMCQSKFSAPHYYLKISATMDGLLHVRETQNAQSEEKISLNAFLIRLTAEALKNHPMVNTSWSGETIVKHHRIDIAVAVAQEDGLIAPVVRDCGEKGILVIDKELRALVDKARKGTLVPEEYSDATFTISNLGAFGIEEFTAIINQPGSAILTLGKIEKQAVVGSGDIVEVHSIMIMKLSCDHRIIDGAVGAAFLRDLKEMLEYPIKSLY
jgi:pyruvate dehydrogenase E2 component (dihydrolipoamide acetyltransferase)